MTLESSRNEVAQREVDRCVALVAGDVGKLEGIISKDLVHIHLNGKSDTGEAYLEGVRSKYRFIRVNRGALNIRIYDGFAVMTGPLSQSVKILASGETIDVDAITTQTWIRSRGLWLLNTCHNAMIPA